MESGRKGRYNEKNFKHHRHIKALIANGSLRKGKERLPFGIIYNFIFY